MEDQKQPEEENPNRINEEPEDQNAIEDEDDLNSSYIDEEDFGYQVDERRYETRIESRGIAENEPRMREDIRQEAPQQRDDRPRPDGKEYCYTTNAVQMVPFTNSINYAELKHAMENVYPPFNGDSDGVRLFEEYKAALAVLSSKEDVSVQRTVPVDLGSGVSVDLNVSVKSKEQAWDIVHGKGNLERVLNYGNEGANVRGLMRKHLASPRLEGDDLEKGLAFLKERDGQENPYRSAMTENGPVSGPGMPTDYPRATA